MRALAFLLLLVACHSAPKSTVPFRPSKPTSGGSALLALVPRGADAVIEFDLSRLRENPRLAPLLADVAARAQGSALAGLGFDPLRNVDVALCAVYRMGTDDAELLVLARGASLAAKTVETARSDALAVDAQTVAFGPRRAAREVGLAPPFLALRDAAIPAKATGAAVRVTFLLPPLARVSLAGTLGLDEFPKAGSIWADVADDAALLALFSSEDDDSARRITRILGELLERTAASLGLRGHLEASHDDNLSKLSWVVGPREWATFLGRSTERP